MLKRRHYLALSSVIVLTLIFLNLPNSTTARIKLAIGSLFLPLFGLASSAHQLADKAGNAIVPRSELLKENETLRRENQQLHLQLMQSQETSQEDARLRRFYGWMGKTPWKLKLGRVVLCDPANWWQTVQIDLGSRDGVHVNQPVLTPDGLVGRIASVSLTRSQVVLLGDPNCKVSALVEDTRDPGIISPSGSLPNSMVRLTFLPGDPKLKPGQAVVTSGEGGVFPKGIRIGSLVDWKQVDYGLYTEARVKLSVNLSRLEEVCVLFQ